MQLKASKSSVIRISVKPHLSKNLVPWVMSFPIIELSHVGMTMVLNCTQHTTAGNLLSQKNLLEP